MNPFLAILHIDSDKNVPQFEETMPTEPLISKKANTFHDISSGNGFCKGDLYRYFTTFSGIRRNRNRFTQICRQSMKSMMARFGIDNGQCIRKSRALRWKTWLRKEKGATPDEKSIQKGNIEGVAPSQPTVHQHLEYDT